MSALIDLNKSLHNAKANILLSCGELVLLDLGSGRLKLINDELHEETGETVAVGATAKVTATDTETATTPAEHQHHLTPAQKEACVDFLLRMKLRRKLSNRLIRRLNRVAHAMDGKDVSPPAPPKYGDLRLHIDPKSIESRIVEWKEQEDARQRIENAINADLNTNNNGESSDKVEEESTGNAEPAQKVEEVKKQDDEEKLENNNQDGERGKSEEEKSENSPDEAQSEEPPKPDPMDCSSPTETEVEKEAVESAARADSQLKSPKHYYSMLPLLDDFERLKEHEKSFEKSWDASTKSFKYVLANEEIGDPEYTQMTQGVGIGASSMNMTLEDREAEHKRWQTNMLRRIPEQPTSEELGLKNRVFHLEERRKRCLEDEEQASLIGEGSPVKKMKLDEEDEDEKANKESSTGRRGSGKELRKMEDDDDDDDNNKMDVEGDEEEKKENSKGKGSGNDGEKKGDIEDDHESDHDGDGDGDGDGDTTSILITGL